MQLIFMGTPDFAVPVLERLLKLGHDVLAVYTQADKPSGRGREPVPPPVKRATGKHGLPTFQPEKLKEDIERLEALKPEVIVVAAYGKLLPQRVLNIPPLGCLNLHPSLLPRHRGPAPISGAILAGDEETGASLMLMDAGMDTGPLLAQTRVPIHPQDTTGSLTDRLAQISAQLLEESLPRWVAGELKPQPQDHQQATYTHMLAKEQGEIDWKRPTLELWRQVRAFQPWPGSFTYWQGRLLKIVEATPLPGAAEPGRVVALKGAVALGVGTGEGVLGLRVIQLEGKRALTAEEFVRGARGFAGSLLPSRG
ncbi:MAG: methionyl-tRNA formyltransferase [Chloroflexota bacterium]|nr:methionyl-tRNA formyltransferase [Chloroflexota bacterium]